MFDNDVRREIERVAKARNWEAAALLAVADVESAGTAFATVNGRREPLIRFEAHYFDRRLNAKDRAVAREKGLANPTAGAVKNPASQAARWRMFNAAAAIDRKAAIESVSWGIGQVMGAHWAWLGYRSPEDLVLDARNGVYGQVRLMAGYINKADLAKALTGHDWNAFARGYNGPGYKQNGYDTKLAAAYKRYSALPPLPEVPAPKLGPIEPAPSPISGPPPLGTPIPGAVGAKNAPTEATTPKPSNPKASEPKSGDLGTTPKRSIWALLADLISKLFGRKPA